MHAAELWSLSTLLKKSGQAVILSNAACGKFSALEDIMIRRT
jgi:hypothetical protein